MSEYEKQLFLVHMEALHKYRLRSGKNYIVTGWPVESLATYSILSYI